MCRSAQTAPSCSRATGTRHRAGYRRCGNSSQRSKASPASLLDAYVVRGDFSRWIGDVFGDRALADELRRLEDRHCKRARAETLAEIAAAVRGRYDLAEDLLQAVAG